ncbi:hypothetical protein SEA_POKYPUPPY_37 [Gordonia phage PokyPuppy]|nr:hypothetical protein SEA_POKYPUPPY_37 [Gordonia phage PokyPuppy]
MNDIITLLLGGGLAASVIEAIKFVTTRRQVKRKDEAASQNEEASAQATIGGAWKDLWQTNDQWNQKLNGLLQTEREKGELYVDIIQDAVALLPVEQADPLLDRMYAVRRT